MFEGLPNSSPSDEGYTPPSPSLSSDLAAGTVAEFYKGIFDGMLDSIMNSEDLEMSAGFLISRALSAGLPEPQRYLDTVIGLLCAGGEHRFIPEFLDAQVQALYLLGHNGFFLDLSGFDTSSLYLADDLRGTAERPLEAIYRVAAQLGTFGDGLAHCRLTLLGDTEDAGSFCSASEITVNGAVSAMGTYADECVFRLENVKAVDYRPSTSSLRAYSHNTFYVRAAPSPGERLRFERKVFDLCGDGFWTNGNTLYAHAMAEGGTWRAIEAPFKAYPGPPGDRDPAHDCRFHMPQRCDDREKLKRYTEQFAKGGFFEHGNLLLQPDGSGGWEVVTP